MIARPKNGHFPFAFSPPHEKAAAGLRSATALRYARIDQDGALERLIEGYPGLLRPMSDSPDETILASVARTVLSKPGRRPVKAQTLKVG